MGARAASSCRRGRAGLLALAASAAGALLPTPAHGAEQQAFAAALTYTTPAVAAGQGDTLRFTNLDSLAQHDLDSDEAGLFESPLVSAGESALVNGVDKLKAGTYSFHCSIHSWMKGAVTVAPAGGGPGPEPEPPPPPNNEGANPMTLAPTAPVEPLEAGRWPSYGKDRANSRDAGPNGPSFNEAPRLGPVWSRKSTDGDFTGTPVVARGTLVMGASGGTVFALDPEDGSLRWKRDLIAETREDDARISASAAISGDRVYVPVNAVGRPAVAALDIRNGRLVWKKRIDRQERSDAYGSPQVSDGVVYIGTSGYFGEQVTGVEVSARGSVVALNAQTGRRLWKTYVIPKGNDGAAVWSTPAIDPRANRLYIGTGNAYHAPAADRTDSMLQLSTRTGRILRHFQATAGDVWNGVEDSAQSPDADFGASPNLFELPDGRKVVGQGQKSGVYWTLSRGNMRPVWNSFTGPGSFQGGIVGSTAYDGRRIYGPNSVNGEIWALTRTGGTSWVSSDGTPLHFGAVSVSNGLAYSNDMSGFLTAREATTGAVLAKLPLGAPSWAGVAIAGRSVFTATGTSSDSGYIVAYRARG